MMVSHTESKKARDTRNNLMRTWVKPFGLMELLVVDQVQSSLGKSLRTTSASREFWSTLPMARAHGRTGPPNELVGPSRTC